MLISVDVGHERTNLSVPDDLPVEALLPLLAGACGADADVTWTLLPRGGRAIDPGGTLREAGVLPGALLALRPAAAAAAQRGRSAARIAGLERAIAAAPRQRGVVLAIASPQAGCGRTTVAVLLAMLLARALPEPPLAVDADLRSRGLSLHLAPHLRLSRQTYLDVVSRRLRLGDLSGLTAGTGPGGIAVLPAPDQSAASPDAAECTALVAHLRTEDRVILLDGAAGFSTPWGQAAWAAADQFVLVVDDRAGDLDALAAVATTLAGAGIPVAVVANRAGRRPRTARSAAALGLPGPIVALRDEPDAAAQLRAGVLTWESAPESWRRPIAELAATLTGQWG